MGRRSNVNDLVPWVSMAIAGIGAIIGGITKLIIVSKQLEMQKEQAIAMRNYWQQQGGYPPPPNQQYPQYPRHRAVN